MCAIGSESSWKKRCSTWADGRACGVAVLALLPALSFAGDLNEAMRSGNLDRVQKELAAGANINE